MAYIGQQVNVAFELKSEGLGKGATATLYVRMCRR